MAATYDDLKNLRSILRTPHAVSSGRAEGSIDWTIPKALPFESDHSQHVFISRLRQFYETYNAEEYDRSCIACDSEANKALRLHKSVSIHQREDDDDEETDTGANQGQFGFTAAHGNTLYNDDDLPPRPQTPHPSRITTAAPLMVTDDSDSSPSPSDLPTPTDEEERAEAFARFYARSSSPALSALSALSNAVDSVESDPEEDAEVARMQALAQFRAKQRGNIPAIAPTFPSAVPIDTIDSTVPDCEGPSGAHIASPIPKRYPKGLMRAGTSTGIVRPKARRAVAGRHQISFANGGFSDMGADEGVLAGF